MHHDALYVYYVYAVCVGVFVKGSCCRLSYFFCLSFWSYLSCIKMQISCHITAIRNRSKPFHVAFVWAAEWLKLSHTTTASLMFMTIVWYAPFFDFFDASFYFFCERATHCTDKIYCILNFHDNDDDDDENNKSNDNATVSIWFDFHCMLDGRMFETKYEIFLLAKRYITYLVKMESILNS